MVHLREPSKSCKSSTISLFLVLEFEQDEADDEEDSVDKEFAFGEELDSLVDDDELLLRAGVDIDIIESSNKVRDGIIEFC